MIAREIHARGCGSCAAGQGVALGMEAGWPKPLAGSVHDSPPALHERGNAHFLAGRQPQILGQHCG